MREQQLDRIEAALGPVAVLSLDERGLLPRAMPGPDRGSGAEVVPARAAGALVGAAIGSALGRPAEGRAREELVERFGILDEYRSWADPMAPRRGNFLAEVQLMLASADCAAAHGVVAPRELASRLGGLLPRLRRPGNAVRTAVDRLGAGAPWFEAGAASVGNTALLRAVAVALAYATDPGFRPYAVALDAVVTHATSQAVAAAVALGEVVVAVAASPDPTDAAATCAAVAADTCGHELVAGALRHVDSLRQAGAEPGLDLPSGSKARESLAAGLFHALSNIDDPERALVAAVSAGGDAPAVAAVTGAVVGAAVGLEGLPERWRNGLGSVDRVVALAGRLVGEPVSCEAEADEAAPLHVGFLMDRSGSMGGLEAAVVEGFNGLVNQHRDGEGECRLTLAQFDSEDPFEVICDSGPIDSVQRLRVDQFQPRAMTPLYDAMGALLGHMDAEATRRAGAGLPTEDVLYVVFTDGLENHSRSWSRQRVFDAVEERKDLGWSFVFLGANQDSYETGGALGFSSDNLSDFQPSVPGVDAAFAQVTRASLAHRGRGRVMRREHADEFFDGIKEAEEHMRH
ncbi:MAG: ADP-ribosylglycohydrolase family protein [Acidimicrobiia bacterium]